jgi:hypothetical protein
LASIVFEEMSAMPTFSSSGRLPAPLNSHVRQMVQPRRIETITLDDLMSHRWCYFHDDGEGFDAFQNVIPDTHPRFNENAIELELAIFTFRDGEERFGMFDGSSCFSIFVNCAWFSLWRGVSEPSEAEIVEFRKALLAESIALPVRAKAKWSGTTKEFTGIRYFNSRYEEVEANV